MNTRTSFQKTAYQQIAFTLSLLALLAMTTPVSAQPGSSRPGMKRGQQQNQMAPGGKLKRFLNNLNLTQEQRLALKDFRESREELRIEKQRMKLTMMELMQSLKSGASDGDVLKKVSTLNQQMTATNTRRAQAVLELRGKLSKEQFEKIWQVMSLKMMQQRGHGRDNRGGYFREGGMQSQRGAGGQPPEARELADELEFSLEEPTL